MKKFLQNTEKVTQEISVKDCVSTAKETENPSMNEMANKNEQPENLCSYMGIIALEAFVAELYINYIMGNENSDHSNSLTRTIENAIWELNDGIGFDESVEGIKHLVKEHYGEVDSDTDIDTDMLLLRIIGYSNERHSMAYYIGKVEELVEKYDWEIQKEKDLKTRVDEFIKQDWHFYEPVSTGRNAYNPSAPKPLNPYTETELRHVWYIGYELQRIEELLRRTVNEGETTIN